VPVTLTLRLGGEQQQFRPGEVIPIELEFDSAIPKRFVVDGATYDRIGRLHIDEFDIEPARSVVDPLSDYFAPGRGGLGGIRGMHVLGEKPAVVKLDLNEWLRIDRPGTYRLRVRSRRVTDESQRREGVAPVVVPVESNDVTLEILPRDPDWEAGQLATALRTLDSTGSSLDQTRSCRVVRFLGTDGAIDEMVRRFDAPSCGFHFIAGLYGAPNRSRVLEQMSRGVAAPDQAVSSGYLRTLAALSILRRHPELRAAGAARRDLEKADISALVDLLAASLPAKTGRARAAALLTLLEMRRIGEDEVRHAVAGAFHLLPAERQRTLLEFEWGRLSGSRMLPALRALAAGTAPTSTEVRDLALRRLYELAPDEGRPLVLAAIREPPPGATLEALGMLPDRELPQLDDDLVRNVEPPWGDAFTLRAQLLQRYGSAAVSSRVFSAVGQRLGSLACDPKAALIAYFLRVDPHLGTRLLEEALAERSTTGCYQMLLRAVARLRMTPALEAAALARLDDPDAELAANAIAMLGEFGSPAARDPLRRQFERWSERWTGRAEELRYSYAQKSPHAPHGMVEHALYSALGRARSWVTGPDELLELRALCVTETCRGQIDHMIAGARGLVVRVSRFERPDDCFCSVAQYDLRSMRELEDKLSQYPPGTPFVLDVSPLDPKTAAIVADRVTQIARRRGFAIR
jgi:hypothetical protein